MSDQPTCVIALDAGTTGVRSRAVFTDDTTCSSYREFTQHYPSPGWVEHDADEIWERIADTLRDVLQQVHERGGVVAALGITNQRETVLAWSRRTGRPYGTAIVWQDRRTSQFCDELKAEGFDQINLQHTGLVTDAYFS